MYVLVMDDEWKMTDVVGQALQQAGADVVQLSSPSQIDGVEQAAFDVVVGDALAMTLGRMMYPQSRRYLLVHDATEWAPSELVALGVHDAFIKGQELEALVDAVLRDTSGDQPASRE